MTTTQIPVDSTVALPQRLVEFLSTHPENDIGGTAVGADGSAATTTITYPFTGGALATFRNNSAGDVGAKAACAKVAGEQWAATRVGERAEVFIRLHRLLRTHEELILDLVQAENGKSRLHAYYELLELYAVCRFLGVNLPGILKPQRRTGAIPGLTRVQVEHPPLGVVGFISPWNYPLSLGAGDPLSALAAGNAVLQKVDSQTPLTVVLVRRLIVKAGLPADAWQLVPGEVDEVSDALLDCVQGVSFTGSTAVGRVIGAEAGRRLIPAALELGGKNPMLVLDDANVDAAVGGAMRGAFGTAGQLCLSFERIYVHASVYDEFCTKFAIAAKAAELGGSYDYGTEIGTLSSEAQLAKVETFVTDAVDAGATLLAGGRARPDLGPWFYEPTVMTDVTSEARFFTEESFGPVVAVYPVANDEEAITAANATEYGLNAAVYSRSRSHGVRVAKQISAGMVNINEAFAAAYGSVAAPAGGMKASGLGHRHGPEGIYQYTDAQTIAHQALVPFAPFGPLTPQRFQTVMSTALDVMRALRCK